MKKWIRFGAISIASLTLLSLVGCSNSNDGSSSNEKSSSAMKASSKKKTEKKNGVLQTIDDLAKSSSSTGEIYVTGKLKVGNKNTLKPGIYDMTVTGGSGNVMGDRKLVTTGMFINWIAGVPNNDGNPSKIRMILFDGDILELTDISKVNFVAVPEKVQMTNQLGIGNYVVGRDIKAGKYKLSTNMKLDPEYNNLGWSLETYNDDSGEERSVNLNPESSDVAVDLKEGEILTTSFTNPIYESNSDSAKLIFTPLK